MTSGQAPKIRYFEDQCGQRPVRLEIHVILNISSFSMLYGAVVIALACHGNATQQFVGLIVIIIIMSYLPSCRYLFQAI